MSLNFVCELSGHLLCGLGCVMHRQSNDSGADSTLWPGMQGVVHRGKWAPKPSQA